MTSPTSISPQPRIDTLVTSAVNGAQGRRTEYSGVLWYGEPPDVSGMLVVNRMGTTRAETPFFLPDSLPYSADATGHALVACSVAIASAASEDHQLVHHAAVLAPDPRNSAVCWVQLQLLGFFRTPIAVSYRVDVLVPPDAVLTSDPTAG